MRPAYKVLTHIEYSCLTLLELERAVARCRNHIDFAMSCACALHAFVDSDCLRFAFEMLANTHSWPFISRNNAFELAVDACVRPTCCIVSSCGPAIGIACVVCLAVIDVAAFHGALCGECPAVIADNCQGLAVFKSNHEFAHESEVRAAVYTVCDIAAPPAAGELYADSVCTFLDKRGNIVCHIEYFLTVFCPARHEFVVNCLAVRLHMAYTLAIDKYVVVAKCGGV